MHAKMCKILLNANPDLCTAGCSMCRRNLFVLASPSGRPQGRLCWGHLCYNTAPSQSCLGRVRVQDLFQTQWWPYVLHTQARKICKLKLVAAHRQERAVRAEACLDTTRALTESLQSQLQQVIAVHIPFDLPDLCMPQASICYFWQPGQSFKANNNTPAYWLQCKFVTPIAVWIKAVGQMISCTREKMTGTRQSRCTHERPRDH